MLLGSLLLPDGVLSFLLQEAAAAAGAGAGALTGGGMGRGPRLTGIWFQEDMKGFGASGYTVGRRTTLGPGDEEEAPRRKWYRFGDSTRERRRVSTKPEPNP